jgi:hypothetical protein
LHKILNIAKIKWQLWGQLRNNQLTLLRHKGIMDEKISKWTHDQRAKGDTCYKCNKQNHFSKQCKFQKNVISVNQMRDNSDIEEKLCNAVDGYLINTVITSLHSQDCVKTEICLGPNNFLMSFKIDTASAANVLPTQEFQKLNLISPMEAPGCKLNSYTGEALPILRKIILTCYLGNQSMIAKFYVVDKNASPLLGLLTALNLGLIKR